MYLDLSGNNKKMNKEANISCPHCRQNWTVNFEAINETENDGIASGEQSLYCSCGSKIVVIGRAEFIGNLCELKIYLSGYYPPNKFIEILTECE